MDAKIITAIIGLFLGSLLNGIGFFLKERYQRIRTINQTIFYLFKLLHANSALKNIEKSVSFYSKMLKEHPRTKELITVEENALTQFLTQFLVSILTPITQEVNEEFKQKFNDSIFELSNVKPVIAYDLSKTSYSEALSQEITRISKSAEPTKNQNQEDKEAFQSGLRASQKHIYDNFEQTLIAGIKKLSWSTNIFTWVSCRREIYRLKKI